MLQGKHKVTLIPGDGIGPEISKSVVRIYAAAGVPVEWEEVDVKPVIKNGKTTVPDAVLESVQRNKVALKGQRFVEYGPVLIGCRTAWNAAWQGPCVAQLDAPSCL